MIAKFSQNCKVVNAVVPVADTFATAANSDVISARGCDSIVFLVMTGAGADNTNVITVEACDDFTPTTSTAVPFTVTSIVSGDTQSAATATAATGKAFTASTANQYYIVEVDPADISAANSNAGDPYVRCVVTEAGNAGAQVGCVVGIRYGEHNAQDELPTAIA
jgi:hypothetical protein